MNREMIQEDYEGLQKIIASTKMDKEIIRKKISETQEQLLYSRRFLSETNPWLSGFFKADYWAKTRSQRVHMKDLVMDNTIKEDDLEKAIKSEDETLNSLNIELKNLAKTYLWHIDLYWGSQEDYAKANGIEVEDVPFNDRLQRILIIFRWDEDGDKKDVSVIGVSPTYLLKQKTCAIVDPQLVSYGENLKKDRYDRHEFYIGRPIKEIRKKRTPYPTKQPTLIKGMAG